MSLRIHPQALTTPEIRQEIKDSGLSDRQAAKIFGITRATAAKWLKRDDVQDRSHRAHTLHTTLSAAQEAIVLALRQSLYLPLGSVAKLKLGQRGTCRSGSLNRMKPAPQKYRTTNWKTYNEALKSRGSLLIWLDPAMTWHSQPSGKRGRSQTFSDEAIQFCLSIKCLFNLPLRQAMGMTQSLLHLAGLNWQVPDYSTVSRRQKTLQVAIGAVPTTPGLHLLVDSTGIKMLGEGEWKTKKHGADYRRQWRKVHLGIDASTLEIRAMEVTGNSIGDAPVLPALLSQIPADEHIASVSGDGAYDTKDCHEAIALRAAHAIIPTRKNAKPWKANRCGADARNDILRATKRLGRAIWKRWSGYHRRSLVETKMRCFKLLGERVMARDFDRQVAELQVRAAVLNRFTRLGTPITVPVL